MMQKLYVRKYYTKKQILPGWKTPAEIDVGNTIEYDMKAYQAKTTILKYEKVKLKESNINHPQK